LRFALIRIGRAETSDRTVIVVCMDDDKKREWLELGEQLRALSEEKFDEVADGLKDVIDAQRVLARFDWQLMFRGRPRKRYLA